MWTGSDQNKLVQGQQLRTILSDKQKDANGKQLQGFYEISGARIDQLTNATSQALQQCWDTYDREIQKRFDYVAHKVNLDEGGKLNAQLIREAVNAHNYDKVRSIFYHGEDSDAVRNVLACYPGKRIDEMTAALP